MPYIGNTSQKFVTADDVTVTDDLTVTDDATIGGALSAKGGAVFNEDSADVDFRVESNNTAHLFFADGGEDVVGIGTPTPVPSNVAYKTAALHIHQEQGGSTGSQIHMTNDATGAAAGNGMFIAMWQDDDVYITNQESDGNIKFATGGTNNVLVLKDGGDIDVGAGDIVFSTAGKGIVLGATSNTAANTLDDYEEGAVTLTMQGANGNPSSTQTISGSYTKVGNMISLRAGAASGINNTGAQGPIQWTGLPFAHNGINGLGVVEALKNATFTNTPYAFVGGTIVYIQQNISEGNYQNVNHHVDTNGGFQINVVYQTA